MVLSKIKIGKFKRKKDRKKSFLKIKAKRFIDFLNRPVNTERLKEIEAEKAKLHYHYPFIK
ncbi:MAG: hypothetical protein ACJAS4_001853 [Bacteriovoracaceae bacterium]|jgi:hypothetical protein